MQQEPMSTIDQMPVSPAQSGDAPFHIAFGIDGRYFRYAGVTITSILENNRDQAFVFHVLAPDVPEAVRQKYQALEQRYGTQIVFHLIDEDRFAEYYQFSRHSQYSPAVFTRLLIPEVLKDTAREVLYLDADILCTGSIAGLRALDLRDDVVAVVSDHLETTVRNRCAALQLPADQYFNSGVLYINVANWIANDITAQVMQAIVQHGQKLVFPDQDALNIVLAGRARYIEPCWNFRYNLEFMLNGGQFDTWLPGPAVFLHFTGRVKPWHAWNLHPSRELFSKYLALSPWAGTPLDAPRHYKEMRMYAGFLRKKKQWGGWLAWYATYLAHKFGLAGRAGK